MSDDRPNVTVIYQPAKAPGATFGAVLLELIAFLVMAGLIAMIGGCAAWGWL